MVSEELKRYRIAALLTQRRLGEMLGYEGRNAERLVQRWESGELPVPLKHIRKVHDILNMPFEKLIP